MSLLYHVILLESLLSETEATRQQSISPCHMIKPARTPSPLISCEKRKRLTGGLATVAMATVSS